MRVFFALIGLAATVVGAVPYAQQDSQVAASTYWYANVKHNGINPGVTNGDKWTVFRNVLDYGAKGDGKTDDTAAIQKAIDTGDSNGARGSGKFGSTGQPAVVFFPHGTYLTSAPIKNYIGTVLMGDPTNRPSIKASSSFKGANLISGVDPRYTGLVAFYHEIKNLIFDTTSLAATTKITLVDWAVSQACQLSNSVFLMPSGAASHTAIVSSGQNSPLLLNDLEIRGGGVGWTGASTQFHFKNIYFKGMTTAIKPTNTVQISVQGCRFEDITTGIDLAGNPLGMLNFFDSSASNTKTLVNTVATQSNSQGSIAIENVIVDDTVASTVTAGSSALLTGSVTTGNTWVRGNTYSGTAAAATPQKSTGQKIATSRPAALVNSTGFYYTVSPPTYADFTADQVVNVKDVSAYPVKGDGSTDDTASLQSILNDAAKANKIAYFPHGIYIITDTLVVPPGSRLWGESFTELSGSGSKFKDEKNVKAIIQVGKAGETGTAQFTDFVFTVADVLPGAKIVEVNMAGTKPGDVGFFNCHFRIGGGRGTKTSSCASIENCKAVHIAAHLTKTSSAYWENSWAWTADHDLDGGGFGQYPSPAGGFLIEAQQGTWMLGWGVEHFVLYQVTISSAANVFVGLQQGEAAYYQGTGATLLAPAPWASSLLPSDPDFSWCGASSVSCRMSIYQRVVNSTNINLYSGGYWNFVAGPNRSFCSTDCQDNAVLYENNSKLFSYGIGTINNANLVVESGPGGNKYKSAVAHKGNEGSKKDVFETAVMAAYLRQSA